MGTILLVFAVVLTVVMAINRRVRVFVTDWLVAGFYLLEGVFRRLGWRWGLALAAFLIVLVSQPGALKKALTSAGQNIAKGLSSAIQVIADLGGLLVALIRNSLALILFFIACLCLLYFTGAPSLYTFFALFTAFLLFIGARLWTGFWFKILARTAAVGLILLAVVTAPDLKETLIATARETNSLVRATLGSMGTRTSRSRSLSELDEKTTYAQVIAPGELLTDRSGSASTGYKVLTDEFVQLINARPEELTSAQSEPMVRIRIRDGQGPDAVFTSRSMTGFFPLSKLKPTTPEKYRDYLRTQVRERTKPTPPTTQLVALNRGCSLEGPPEYVALVDTHLQQFPTVPRNLALAVASVESNWNPQAVSNRGAQGIMQLMPGTSQQLGVTDPFDPDQNIGGGVQYLAELLERLQSTDLTLAAYNWGPQNIERYPGQSWAQIAPNASVETQEYVARVIALARGNCQPGIQTLTAGGTTPPATTYNPDPLPAGTNCNYNVGSTEKVRIDNHGTAPLRIFLVKEDCGLEPVLTATRQPELEGGRALGTMAHDGQLIIAQNRSGRTILTDRVIARDVGYHVIYAGRPTQSNQ